VGFSSVKTTDIGSGDAPALTSLGGLFGTYGALVAGDLVLNGVQVNASLSTDDVLSTGTAAEKAASAIAKVEAINRVSEQSGVTARVNDTRVLGSAMTAEALTGSVTINGYETSDFSTTTDASTSRANTVKAINDISGSTGVKAIDTGDDNQGILLVAEDGRNIAVTLDTVNAAATGIGTTGTHVGTYSLYTADGSAISVDHQIGKAASDLQKSGLRIGTFESNIAQVVSINRASIADTFTAGTAPAPGILNGDTLLINDVAIAKARATDDTASQASTASLKEASAIAIAAAINRSSDLHGVTAKAEANVLRGTGFTAATAHSLVINGVTITGGVNTLTRNNVIDAINAYSGQTGVVASEFGAGIELRAEDGRNITIGTDALTGAAIGLAGVSVGTSAAPAAHYASISLSSEKAFTVARGAEGSANFEALGFREGTFGGNYTGMKIAEVDVTTQLGAGTAITAIDHAINDVAAAQAKSGAFQNRLDASISVLSESSENASAARSRILDTDYASETTALAKAQIVQQAATAMLAQANQQQQSVLALLQ
jgi:flagellin